MYLFHDPSDCLTVRSTLLDTTPKFYQPKVSPVPMRTPRELNSSLNPIPLTTMLPVRPTTQVFIAVRTSQMALYKNRHPLFRSEQFHCQSHPLNKILSRLQMPQMFIADGIPQERLYNSRQRLYSCLKWLDQCHLQPPPGYIQSHRYIQSLPISLPTSLTFPKQAVRLRGHQMKRA